MNDGQELRRRQAYSIGDVQVVPTAAALGAEIRGVDLTQALSAETLDAVNQAWSEHEVLLFRDLDLTVEQHLAFAGAIGDLEPAVAYREARNIDTGQADALFLSGTNWRTVDMIEKMESDLGIPVFTANQVTMWAALGKLGIPAEPGYGSVMDQS